MLLKARYHVTKLTQEGLKQGMAYARLAIEVDPACADAYVLVSAVYSSLGIVGFLPPAEAFPKAKAAALKALEIDDSLAQAHSFLGLVRLYYEWDCLEQLALKRGIALNPKYAWLHCFWSEWLIIMGHQDEAIAEAQLAVELDPLSEALIFGLGYKLLLTRNYDRAIEQFQKPLELDPNFVAHMAVARAYAGKGMYEESLATCEKVANVLGGSNPFGRALRSLILAMARKADEAKEIVSELKRSGNKASSFMCLSGNLQRYGRENGGV